MDTLVTACTIMETLAQLPELINALLEYHLAISLHAYLAIGWWLGEVCSLMHSVYLYENS